MSQYHNPVLLRESIDFLMGSPTDSGARSGTYADATFGGGGHSREIMSRLNVDGRLVAFDRDADAQLNAIDDPRFTLIHNNFRFIHNYALQLSAKDIADKQANEKDVADRQTSGKEDIDKQANGEKDTNKQVNGKKEADKQANEKDAADKRSNGKASGKSNVTEGRIFDGILADLGVSSHQFDTAERGFSFRFSAPLDMRMNDQAKTTAADIVNTYEQQELERIFRLYGEVDNARNVAQLICRARETQQILTTDALNEAIKKALPAFAEHKYLAKVYQALRIEVNQEMRSLEKFLQGAAASLKLGGRLVIITYHSLEDRMVKNFIKAGNIDGEIVKDIYGRSDVPLEAVNRKPVLPTEEEIESNTRARSAKLRVAIKK